MSRAYWLEAISQALSEKLGERVNYRSVADLRADFPNIPLPPGNAGLQILLDQIPTADLEKWGDQKETGRGMAPQDMYALYEQGASLASIARASGVTREAVRQQIEKFKKRLQEKSVVAQNKNRPQGATIVLGDGPVEQKRNLDSLRELAKEVGFLNPRRSTEEGSVSSMLRFLATLPPDQRRKLAKILQQYQKIQQEDRLEDGSNQIDR